jgi:hypothetical protein
MSLHGQDSWLFTLGIAVALWCISLALYTVVSDSRRRLSSLNSLTNSFSTLLVNLGETLRKRETSPPG